MRVELRRHGALADLMIDHGIGVTALKSYALHRIDEDYFEAD